MFSSPASWSAYSDTVFTWIVNENQYFSEFIHEGDNHWSFSFGLFPDGYDTPPNDFVPYQMSNTGAAQVVLSTVIDVIVEFVNKLQGDRWVTVSVFNSGYNDRLYGLIFERFAPIHGYTVTSSRDDTMTTYVLEILDCNWVS